MAFFEIEGKVVEVGEVKTFASGFEKRSLIVDVTQNDNYPSPAVFEFKNDHVRDAEGLRTGDKVSVKFCIGGHAWEGADGVKKYYTDVTAFGVKVLEKAADNRSSKQRAIDAFTATNGGTFDKDGFIKLCRSVIGDKKSSAYADEDWLKVEAAAAPAQEEQPADDDFPF